MYIWDLLSLCLTMSSLEAESMSSNTETLMWRTDNYVEVVSQVTKKTSTNITTKTKFLKQLPP